jgi:hypothetical protein
MPDYFLAMISSPSGETVKIASLILWVFGYSPKIKIEQLKKGYFGYSYGGPVCGQELIPQ